MKNAQQQILDAAENNKAAEGHSDDLPVGTMLLQGQYEITGLVNRGGWGIAYKALNSLRQKIIVKECFPEAFCRRVGSDVKPHSDKYHRHFKTAVRQFSDEAMQLARLSHPNVVTVHQVFQENSTVYLAMEFIEGTDLSDLIDSGERLPPEGVVKVTEQVLDALAYVHSNDMLHRDIAPDNIIVRHNGQPVLIDFGAAREYESGKSRAFTTLAVVKSGYSPQEFYAAGADQSPASDLYSLAASIYHVISGASPPDAQSRMMAVVEGRDDPYEPLAGRYNEYPPALLAAIDKSMNVRPDERVQSAGDWLEMMKRGDVGQPAPEPDADEIRAVAAAMVSAQSSVEEDPAVAPAVAAAAAGGSEAKSGKAGLMLTAAAVALVAAGGAGFFLMSGGGENSGGQVAGGGGTAAPVAPTNTGTGTGTGTGAATPAPVAPAPVAPATDIADAGTLAPKLPSPNDTAQSTPPEGNTPVTESSPERTPGQLAPVEQASAPEANNESPAAPVVSEAAGGEGLQAPDVTPEARPGAVETVDSPDVERAPGSTLESPQLAQAPGEVVEAAQGPDLAMVDGRDADPVPGAGTVSVPGARIDPTIGGADGVSPLVEAETAGDGAGTSGVVAAPEGGESLITALLETPGLAPDTGEGDANSGPVIVLEPLDAAPKQGDLPGALAGVDGNNDVVIVAPTRPEGQHVSVLARISDQAAALQPSTGAAQNAGLARPDAVSPVELALAVQAGAIEGVSFTPDSAALVNANGAPVSALVRMQDGTTGAVPAGSPSEELVFAALPTAPGGTVEGMAVPSAQHDGVPPVAPVFPGEADLVKPAAPADTSGNEGQPSATVIQIPASTDTADQATTGGNGSLLPPDMQVSSVKWALKLPFSMRARRDNRGESYLEVRRARQDALDALGISWLGNGAEVHLVNGQKVGSLAQFSRAFEKTGEHEYTAVLKMRRANSQRMETRVLRMNEVATVTLANGLTVEVVQSNEGGWRSRVIEEAKDGRSTLKSGDILLDLSAPDALAQAVSMAAIAQSETIGLKVLRDGVPQTARLFLARQ